MSNIDSLGGRLRGQFSGQVTEARRFVLRTAPDGTADRGVVVGGGYEVVDRGYFVGHRTMPFIGLELVAAGKGDGNLAGRPIDLVPGVFVFYDERTPHTFATSREKPLHKYFLDLDPRPARRRFRRLGLPTAGWWRLRQWNDLTRLFDEIIYHGTSASPVRQATCDALLQALLLQIGQAIQATPDTTPAFASYQAVCHAIDTAALRLQSLDELANEVRLDPAYICRLFKRYDHQSPYRRLLHRRMSLAAAELYRGDEPVRKVAERLGYRDPFNFSRAFKSVMGVSPSQFRGNNTVPRA